MRWFQSQLLYFGAFCLWSFRTKAPKARNGVLREIRIVESCVVVISGKLRVKSHRVYSMAEVTMKEERSSVDLEA